MLYLYSSFLDRVLNVVKLAQAQPRVFIKYLFVAIKNLSTDQ